MVKLCDKCGKYIDRKYGDEAERYADDISLAGYEFDVCWDCNQIRRKEIDEAVKRINLEFEKAMLLEQEYLEKTYGGNGLPTA